MPHFRPDPGGRWWSLVRVASSVALRGGAGTAFPVFAAQAPGCSIWSGPCAARGSSPRVLHKSAEQKAAPAFRAFPGLSSSGSQELDGHTLPGCGAPSPFRGPSPSPRLHRSVPAPCVSPRPSRGCRPSRVSGGLWLETGGLFAAR